MKVAVKSVSRDGDIKGKYLYARPRGAAYMKGPPPDTRKRPQTYLRPQYAMRMAPYPGMMQRYDAYKDLKPSEPYTPPPVELPDDIKDEPVNIKEEVTYPSLLETPEAEPIYPTSVEEPDDVLQLTDSTMLNNVANTVRSGVGAITRAGGNAGYQLVRYTASALPHVAGLVRFGGAPLELGIEFLLGEENAEPIIDTIRNSRDSMIWLERRVTDFLRPGVRFARERSLEALSGLASTYLNPVEPFVLPGAPPSPGALIRPNNLFIPGDVLTPGVQGPVPELYQDYPRGTPTTDIPTRVINEPVGGFGAIGGGVSAASVLINYLIASAPANAPAPPPEILRLAGTVSGPAYFAGGRTLRLTPARQENLNRVVNTAIRNNGAYNRDVYQEVLQYWRRRSGRPG